MINPFPARLNRKKCCPALGLPFFWITCRSQTSRLIRPYYQAYSRSNDRGIGINLCKLKQHTIWYSNTAMEKHESYTCVNDLPSCNLPYLWKMLHVQIAVA